MLDDRTQHMHEDNLHKLNSIYRWRWRPGLKPRNAFTLGVLFSVVALLFIGIGLVSLILGIMDSYSPPLQVPGVVVGYTTNILDSLPHVTMRLEKAGSTATIAPAVSRETAHALHVGDHVILDYSQRLHFLYALESEGERYTFPGASSAGDPFGSVALLLLGVILLPYPAFLALWGCRDLHSQGEYIMTARIVGLRSSKQARTSQPGLAPRILRTWYTVELEPVDASTYQGDVNFSIREEMYHALHEGAVVQVMYSPHLHYVYAVKQLDEKH